ncbi:hypothetical protein CALVIDRAFT_526066 [Calocera viscosa TUFC12733]|uniref:Uncharacterized protein n=1 Tax=Calocera viscosa (strain TUFC12733) TaxID=1330018 RepID=A0A167PC69_CALVF|nr:hypothetical protein CALVIDRAFT_526066 [Calocera viscosa TUFC12733]
MELNLPNNWPRRRREKEKTRGDVQADVKEHMPHVIGAWLETMCRTMGLPYLKQSWMEHNERGERRLECIEYASELANLFLEFYYYVELPMELPQVLVEFVENILWSAQTLEDEGERTYFESGKYLHLQLIGIRAAWLQNYPMLLQWTIKQPPSPFEIGSEYGCMELFSRDGGNVSCMAVEWALRIRILHSHICTGILDIAGPPPRLDVATKEESVAYVEDARDILRLIKDSARRLKIEETDGLLKAMLMQHALYWRDTAWRYDLSLEEVALKYGNVPESLRYFVLGQRHWDEENPFKKDTVEALLTSEYAEELADTLRLKGEWVDGADVRSIRCVEAPKAVTEMLITFLRQINDLLDQLKELIIIRIPAELLPLSHLPEAMVVKRCRKLGGLYRRPAKPHFDVESWTNRFTKQRSRMEKDSSASTIRTNATWVVSGRAGTERLQLMRQQSVFFATFNEEALDSAPHELKGIVAGLLQGLEAALKNSPRSCWKYMPNPVNIPRGWREAGYEHNATSHKVQKQDLDTYVNDKKIVLKAVFDLRPEALLGVRCGSSVLKLFQELKIQNEEDNPMKEKGVESRQADAEGGMEVEVPHIVKGQELRDDVMMEEGGAVDKGEDVILTPITEWEEGRRPPVGATHGVVTSREERGVAGENEEGTEGESDDEDDSIEEVEEQVPRKGRGKGKQKRATRKRKTAVTAMVPSGNLQTWNAKEDPRRDQYSFYSAGIFDGFKLLGLDRVNNVDVLPPWNERMGKYARHEIMPMTIMELELTMAVTQKTGLLEIKFQKGDTIDCTNAGLSVPPDVFCEPQEKVKRSELPNKDEVFKRVGEQIGYDDRPPLSQAEERKIAALAKGKEKQTDDGRGLGTEAGSGGRRGEGKKKNKKGKGRSKGRGG